MIFSVDIKKAINEPHNVAIITIWKADDSGEIEYFTINSGQIDGNKYFELFLRNGYQGGDAKKYGVLLRRIIAALQQTGDMPNVPMYYISFNIMQNERHLSIEIPSADQTYTIEFDAVDGYVNGIRNRFLRTGYDNTIAAIEGSYVNNLQRVLFS